MPGRPKLEFPANIPVRVKFLFDDALEVESKISGTQDMWTVQSGGEEYIFYCSGRQAKALTEFGPRKGQEVIITKREGKTESGRLRYDWEIVDVADAQQPSAEAPPTESEQPPPPSEPPPEHAAKPERRAEAPAKPPADPREAITGEVAFYFAVADEIARQQPALLKDSPERFQGANSTVYIQLHRQNGTWWRDFLDKSKEPRSMDDSGIQEAEHVDFVAELEKVCNNRELSEFIADYGAVIKALPKGLPLRDQLRDAIKAKQEEYAAPKPDHTPPIEKDTAKDVGDYVKTISNLKHIQNWWEAHGEKVAAQRGPGWDKFMDVFNAQEAKLRDNAGIAPKPTEE